MNATQKDVLIDALDYAIEHHATKTRAYLNKGDANGAEYHQRHRLAAMELRQLVLRGETIEPYRIA